MHGHYELFALGTLLLVTVLGPLVAVRLHLPTAVVLILAGIGVGPAALGLVRDTPIVAFMSELGFLILMFIAGMEIDFETIKNAGARVLRPPVLSAFGFFVVAVIVGRAFGLSGVQLLVVSASSVGMPIAMLQETGTMRTPLGSYILLAASIGEFFSIVAVICYEMSARHGLGMRLLMELSRVILLFGASALLIRWARAVVWWYPDPFRRMVEHHDVAEIGVRTGLLIMMAFVLLAVVLGVEGILGAFIAGALVAFVLREKHALEAKIAALGHGLFIPIFFVVVGVRFDPKLIDAQSIREALLLALVVAAAKYVPALLFGGRDLGLRDRIAAGTLLSAPLTLVVAIGAIGQKLKLITDRQAASIVLLALLLSVVFPVLFKLIVGKRATADAPAH